MATLSESELKEAIREWASKRGLPVTDSTSILIKASYVSGTQSTNPTSEGTNYAFIAVIGNMVMAPQHGPYR